MELGLRMAVEVEETGLLLLVVFLQLDFPLSSVDFFPNEIELLKWQERINEMRREEEGEFQTWLLLLLNFE